MFRFKKFLIHDDLCAMKVGTDGVLLGAWVELSPVEEEHETPSHCIDVGTGCGLIAMMLAQRFPSWQFKAIEIDTPAATQARSNVSASPFGNRISVENGDFLQLPLPYNRYDAIVSNPPFFLETFQSPDMQRALARHTAFGFDFPLFVRKSSALLRSGGSLQVILPGEIRDVFHAECSNQGFTLARQTWVRTVAHKPPKRVLLHFIKGSHMQSVESNELILMENGQRTMEYARLCEEFYL